MYMCVSLSVAASRVMHMLSMELQRQTDFDSFFTAGDLGS